ncbi:MAG: hypothetical protein F4Y86_05175 [Gammaproteobacteria bacterium]|nr:hypothetical protein [Gammaproteobacteria bacterium]
MTGSRVLDRESPPSTAIRALRHPDVVVETRIDVESAARLDIQTDKKLLTIGEDEPPLKGYRCFLAITNRIQEEHGDFFLQPHGTSVV